MKFYKQEKLDGLHEKLRGPGRLAFASSVTPIKDIAHINEWVKKVAKEKAGDKLTASIEDLDLYPLNSVLVSTGWNLNDAVFDPHEVFTARHTPEDKPVNYEHDEVDIIGHMTSSKVLDKDGNLISDDTSIDELPEHFDIHTSAVLYKIWSNEKLQDRMSKIIAEIAENKWCVSMECLFKNFDYALLEKDGTQKIIARNGTTSFLTKYLRFYGGTGVYNDAKVGMVLRDFIFSGKGLVKNPANPSSVIYDFSSAKAKYYTDFVDAGYNPLRESPKIGTVQNMEKDLALALEAQKVAETELAKTNEATKVAEKAREDAVAAKVEADKKISEFSTSLEKANEVNKNLEASKVETDKILKNIKKELAEISEKHLKAVRTQLVVDKGLEKADAEKYVINTITSTDEQFASAIEILGKESAKSTKKILPEVEDNKPAVTLPDTTKASVETVTPSTTVTGPSTSKTLASLIRIQSGKPGKRE